KLVPGFLSLRVGDIARGSRETPSASVEATGRLASMAGPACPNYSPRRSASSEATRSRGRLIGDAEEPRLGKRDLPSEGRAVPRPRRCPRGRAQGLLRPDASEGCDLGYGIRNPSPPH